MYLSTMVWGQEFRSNYPMAPLLPSHLQVCPSSSHTSLTTLLPLPNTLWLPVTRRIKSKLWPATGKLLSVLDPSTLLTSPKLSASPYLDGHLCSSSWQTPVDLKAQPKVTCTLQLSVCCFIPAH
jgi:hypothetical protein